MASLKAARRSDPFRMHNPHVPLKNPQLSEEQWETLKPRIVEMHTAGWTCVDMLKELKSMDVVVTRPQLDLRLKKWEIVNLKKHQNHRELRGSEKVTTSDIWPLQNQSTSYPLHALSSEDVGSTTSQTPHIIPEGRASLLPSDLGMVEQRRSWDQQPPKRSSSPPSDDFGNFPETTWTVDPYSLFPLRLELPQYGVSYTVWNLFGGLDLPGLAYTALLLADMRCFDRAFDVWLSITSILNDAILSDSSLGPQLVFVAATCASCPQSDQQRPVADVIIEQLHYWRGQGRLLEKRNDSEELRGLLALAEARLVEDSASLKHWATTHYSAKVINAGHGEDEIHIGAWFASKELWTKDLRNWPRDILDSFFGSHEIQAILLAALRVIECYIEHRERAIDELLGKYWIPDQSTSASFAQALACLIVEDYHLNPSFSWYNYYSYLGVTKSTPVPADSEELFIMFKGQALVIVTFVVVHWIQKSDALRKTIESSRKRFPRCSGGLYLAVQRVKQALDRHSILKDTEYQEFVEVYLQQLNATSQPSSIIFSSDGMVRTAAALASVRPLTQKEARGSEPAETVKVPGQSNHGQAQVMEQSLAMERLSISSSIMDPPMARSYRSSMSSAFRSMRALSTMIRLNGSITNLSMRTVSTRKSSVRQSTTSDMLMGGIEEATGETNNFF
ncbi:hypothetical protein H2200_003830 [Cladophialophora chaetospira]|uniref:Clr5 domain-containing protein n=1 Tax=Cladophialophora chaetospira TaxID=386627 RepID=A0AA38XEY2_9EURO|nr:hypothetical protein H2200_003830 [Cladophialophora chaetospira]